MLFRVAASIKDIFSFGTDFPWPRPDRCPRCHGWKVVGHGYVTAYFDGWPRAVYLRRWRARRPASPESEAFDKAISVRSLYCGFPLRTEQLTGLSWSTTAPLILHAPHTRPVPSPEHPAAARGQHADFLRPFNYVSFSFKGKAADQVRRVRRASFVSLVLEGYDFTVSLKGDASFARVEAREEEFMKSRLRIRGCLIMHTRQLDMVMNNDAEVLRYRQKFHTDIRRILNSGGSDQVGGVIVSGREQERRTLNSRV